MRRALVALLLVAAMTCGALAWRDTDRAAARPEPGPALSAPLWSARRVPQPIVDAVGAARLQQQLDAAVAGNDACFSVLGSTGPLAGHNEDLPVIPASTQKLLTSAAALAVLGPDTTLVTRVVATGTTQSGTAERLFLIGGGDPLLSTAEFRAQQMSVPEQASTPTTPMETLADAIVAKGIRQVTNGITGDDTRYETLRYLPSWPASYRSEGQVGPLGALTVNHGYRAIRPRPVVVDDPAIWAAAELTRLLQARGVQVGGSPGRGQAPPNAVEIAQIASVPVKDLVGDVLRASDNTAAEMLVREIGVKGAKEGTTAAGLRVVAAKLTELGLPTQGLQMVDGSGLDRGNRVTCRLLAAVVDLGARPEFAALWEGLPVAAQSGTLVDEFQGTGLEGHLRAKTGFLNGVTGLAGLLDVGRPLRFAFVGNGSFGQAGAVRLRSAVAQVIARFPDAPGADQLVPVPGS